MAAVRRYRRTTVVQEWGRFDDEGWEVEARDDEPIRTVGNCPGCVAAGPAEDRLGRAPFSTCNGYVAGHDGV